MLKHAPNQTHLDHESTLAQSHELLALLRSSDANTRLIALAASIVVVIVLNAIAQVRLNTWQGDLYDPISKHDLGVFYRQLAVFGTLVSVLLTLGVAQTWLQETLKVRLRAAVVHDLFDKWLRPKRPYRMPLAGEISAHPDQGLQDNTRRLTELCVDLGVGLIQPSLLLVSFVGVLWVLSEQVVFVLSGTSFSIPGYIWRS